MANKMLENTAMTLTAVGGINWGLIGLFDYNLVDSLLGGFPMIVKGIYISVGVGAVYLVLKAFNIIK